MKELYASFYQFLISLVSTIVVISLLIYIDFSYPINFNINIPITILISAIMIVYTFLTYLSYKGKIPLYRQKE